MSYRVCDENGEVSRALLKLSGGDDPRVSWESLPKRGRLPREEGDDYIRLLDIKPSEINHLSIDIRIYKLSIAPKYTALSYVWGTDSKDFCRMNNLNSCLAHIGLHRPGLWWIDAICINQVDTEEKNYQVALMKFIYEKASQVYAWLGEADHSDCKVIQLFQKIEKSLIRGEIGVSRCKIRWENTNLEELNLEDIDSEVWTSLIAFFGRPYFSRTWVLQELMFKKGPNNVVFGCGQLECHASAVWRSVNFLDSSEWIRAILERCWILRGSNDVNPRSHVNRIMIRSLRNWNNVRMHTKIISTMHANGSIPLRTLILATFGLRTREPRDKVLALLSMTRVRNVNAYGIGVDYSQPVEELYRNVTGCLTVKTQSYHLLALSQHPHDKRLQSLPSWVPDYSTPSLDLEVENSIMKSCELSASAGSMSWSQGSATLGVKVRIIDEIEDVADIAMPPLQATTLLAWLQMLATYLDVDIKLVLYRLLGDWKDGNLDIEKPVDKAIHHILSILLDDASAIQECVRHFAAFLFPNPRVIGSPVLKGCEKLVRLANTSMKCGFLGEAARFPDYVTSLTRSTCKRSLVITKSGRAGLGTVLIREGDVLARFDGRYVLNCLRPRGSGHYSLVDGPFFTDGLNAHFIKPGRHQREIADWQSISLD